MRPVTRKLNELIGSAGVFFAADPLQLRAASLLDEFFIRSVSHRSDKNICALLPRFDMQVFGKSPGPETHDNHAAVEEYTSRLAQQNRTLLRKQGGAKDHQVRVNTFSEKKIEKKIDKIPENLHTTDGSPPPISSSNRSMMNPPSLYLYGSVGRGKTLLMDELFSALRQHSSVSLRRLHFFELMGRIHSGIARVPLVVFANEFAHNCDILCLDEIALSDVQDMSVFSVFFSIILRRGVAVIMTSNEHPENLYLHGLNRHVFLPPLVKELRTNCRIISLGVEGEDYRLKQGGRPAWRWLNGLGEKMKKNPDTSYVEQLWLSASRVVELPVVDGCCVSVDADFLLGEQFGDYDSLANFLCENKYLLRVRIGSPFQKKDAFTRIPRFAKLVETLYDKRECFVEFMAEVGVEELFSGIGNNPAIKRTVSRLRQAELF